MGSAWKTYMSFVALDRKETEIYCFYKIETVSVRKV